VQFTVLLEADGANVTVGLILGCDLLLLLIERSSKWRELLCVGLSRHYQAKAASQAYWP